MVGNTAPPEFLVDVLDIAVDLEMDARGNGRQSDAAHAGVLLDQQAATLKWCSQMSLSRHVAPPCSRVDVGGQRAESQAVGRIAEFHSLEGRFGHGDDAQVLLAQADKVSATAGLPNTWHSSPGLTR